MSRQAYGWFIYDQVDPDDGGFIIEQPARKTPQYDLIDPSRTRNLQDEGVGKSKIGPWELHSGINIGFIDDGETGYNVKRRNPLSISEGVELVSDAIMFKPAPLLFEYSKGTDPQPEMRLPTNYELDLLKNTYSDGTILGNTPQGEHDRKRLYTERMLNEIDKLVEIRRNLLASGSNEGDTAIKSVDNKLLQLQMSIDPAAVLRDKLAQSMNPAPPIPAPMNIPQFEQQPLMANVEDEMPPEIPVVVEDEMPPEIPVVVEDEMPPEIPEGEEELKYNPEDVLRSVEEVLSMVQVDKDNENEWEDKKKSIISTIKDFVLDDITFNSLVDGVEDEKKYRIIKNRIIKGQASAEQIGDLYNFITGEYDNIINEKLESLTSLRSPTSDSKALSLQASGTKTSTSTLTREIMKIYGDNQNIIPEKGDLKEDSIKTAIEYLQNVFDYIKTDSNIENLKHDDFGDGIREILEPFKTLTGRDNLRKRYNLLTEKIEYLGDFIEKSKEKGINIENELLTLKSELDLVDTKGKMKELTQKWDKIYDKMV